MEKQEIVQVMSGQCLDKNKQSSVRIRIAEVSKNHVNQRFRVKISVPKCNGSCNYDNFVVSDPILVLSKKKKRLGIQHIEATTNHIMAKKLKRSSISKLEGLKDLGNALKSTPIPNLSNKVVDFAKIESPMRTGVATAPFTPETPNLCLWANAAFDLLSKLQWQRALADNSNNLGRSFDAILALPLPKVYECPSCHETYGETPMHRNHCDLMLLLERDGNNETGTKYKNHNEVASFPLQWSSDKHVEWRGQAQSMFTNHASTLKAEALSIDSIVQDTRKTLKLERDDMQALLDASKSAPPTTISSWKDYASISQLLFSTSFEFSKIPQLSTSLPSTVQSTGMLPPVGTLSRSILSNSGAVNISEEDQVGEKRHRIPSQRYPSLLAAKCSFSTDAANLFQETELALHGNGRIVSSMNLMNITDYYLRPNVGNIGNDDVFHGHVSSAAPLPSDSFDKRENQVKKIMANDFQGCGFPALDDLSNLVGFYQVLTDTNNNPAELQFAPHLFPLPEEMLLELKTTIAEWGRNLSICWQRQSIEGKNEETLVGLKKAVLEHILR